MVRPQAIKVGVYSSWNAYWWFDEGDKLAALFHSSCV